MNKILRFITIVLVSFFGASRYASAMPMYLGLGLVSAEYEGHESPTFYSTNITDNTDAMELYGGYHFNKSFSVEIAYSDFSEVSGEYSSTGEKTYIAPNMLETTSLERTSISLLGEYPIFKQFNFIGIIGYSYFDVDSKQHGGAEPVEKFSPTRECINYGLGARYLFNEKFSTRIQWTRDKTDSFDLDSYRLSVEINFDPF